VIDDALLEEFCAGFFGYGSFAAPIWFIGMEEGGGKSAEEIAARLAAWAQFERSELVDACRFHERTGLGKWFRPSPPIQRTWGKAIRVLLKGRQASVTRSEVREYQATHFGRCGGETCMLDLLPLPSRSTKVKDWIYASASRLPWLATRRDYETHLLPSRERCLRERISRFRPRAIVFFGLQYSDRWERIAGMPLRTSSPEPVAVCAPGGTCFLAARHPASWGAPNSYFDRIGDEVAAHLGVARDSPIA
jgi:hypothetical protein